MAHYHGKTHVKAKSMYDDSDEDDYTVPIPEGLTEYFEPSKPVTNEQIIAWETKGIEPYPGYADEEEEWDKAWEMVNRAQAEADGHPYLVLPTAHPQPDFDADGQPTDFDDPEIVVNPDSGLAKLYVAEDTQTEDADANDAD